MKSLHAVDHFVKPIIHSLAYRTKKEVSFQHFSQRRRPDLNPTIKHIENSLFTESRLNTDVANIS